MLTTPIILLGNPNGKRGWQWVMVTAAVTVFIQGLSRSTAAAVELLGRTFGRIVVRDRFSTCNHLPLEQRQLCWAHLIRDLAPLLNALAPVLNSRGAAGPAATAVWPLAPLQGGND